MSNIQYIKIIFIVFIKDQQLTDARQRVNDLERENKTMKEDAEMLPEILHGKFKTNSKTLFSYRYNKLFTLHDVHEM